jgi:hypothetical protein
MMINLVPRRSCVASGIQNQQTMLLFETHSSCRRTALVARWGQLVRETLPSVAAHYRWPIVNDHCFMRVCLDTALGGPWHKIIKRPAIRHLSDDQLAAAVAVAESLLQTPELLEALNRQSIVWRKELLGRA